MSGSSGRSSGAIAGIVAALVALLLIVVLFVVVITGGSDDCVPGSPTAASAPSGSHVKPTDPAQTSMTSGFGERWGTQHQGNDYAGPEGTAIHAFTDGRVVDAGPASGFGNWIVIDHEIDGQIYSTVYGHMWDDGVSVATGDQVSAGQRIGAIGNNGESTGAHLHFEIWQGPRLGGGTALDPTSWVEDAAAPGEALSPPPVSGGELAPVGGLNERQLALAEHTVAVGEAMGVPEQGIVVALATTGQESTYRLLANSNVPDSLNYPHDGVGSDHDSVNQFQQRVGMWGTAEELMNATTSNVKFYNALLAVPGWEAMAVTVAAQTVQRSAYPDAYADDEPLARTLAARFAGASAELDPVELDAIRSGTAVAVSVAAGGQLAGCTSAPSNPEAPGYVEGGPFGMNVIAAAARWIGTPYAWGGGDANGPTRGISDGGGFADANGDSGKTGFDCSGLTLHAIYQASGGQIELPHFTGSRANPGQLYDPRGTDIAFEQKQPGDLIFFGSDGDTHHVGIYYGVEGGQEMLLNAPQSGDVVSIQPLSNWSGDQMYVRRFG